MPLYFAYGSNLSTDQLQKRCRSAEARQVGRLQGYRLDFTYCSPGWEGGVADVVRACGHEVWGRIYLLSCRDLCRLDGYEGYPDAYTRFQACIKTAARTVPGVWVYTVVHKSDFIPPAKEYLAIIKRAAVEFGFPETYRSYLEGICAR